MKFLALLSSTLAIFGAVSALPNPMPKADLGTVEPLFKREAKDKSGNTQIALKCSSATIPGGGDAAGGTVGGVGNFNSDVQMTIKGQKVSPKCTKKSAFCDSCKFEGHGLSDPIDVEACYNPAGGKRGCGLDFTYKGHHYKEKDDKCGSSSKFQPFENNESYVCYFNA